MGRLLRLRQMQRSQAPWRPDECETHYTASRVELRAEATDDDRLPLLRGHAAVFDKISVPLWGFREKIEPGAFAETLENGDDVRALLEHEGGLNMLGRSTSEPPTLRMHEDKRGLAVEIDPPDTSAGRDTVELVRRGDLSQMSFGFQVLDDKWETKDGEEIRTLHRVKLFDVSVVTFPAYEESGVEVALRSLAAWQERTGADWRARMRTRKLILTYRDRRSGYTAEVAITSQDI